MVLTKLETQIIIQGMTEATWQLRADTCSNECYEEQCNIYNATCDKIEQYEIERGTDLDDEEIDITGYPIRQIPPIKKGFE